MQNRENQFIEVKIRRSNFRGFLITHPDGDGVDIAGHMAICQNTPVVRFRNATKELRYYCEAVSLTREFRARFTNGVSYSCYYLDKMYVGIKFNCVRKCHSRIRKERALN